jgi:hypothetical protein
MKLLKYYFTQLIMYSNCIAANDEDDGDSDVTVRVMGWCWWGWGRYDNNSDSYMVAVSFKGHDGEGGDATAKVTGMWWCRWGWGQCNHDGDGDTIVVSFNLGAWWCIVVVETVGWAWNGQTQEYDNALLLSSRGRYTGTAVWVRFCHGSQFCDPYIPAWVRTHMFTLTHANA